VKGALLVACLLAGCRAGTFVVVELRADAPLSPARVALDLSLGARHADAELRGPIALPADFALDVQSGAGTLTIHARALDGAGAALAEGDATVEVTRDHTARATLLLHAAAAGADGGDAAPADGDATPADATPDGSDANGIVVLEVALGGDGAGRVTSPGGEIACPTTCRVSFPRGIAIRLDAAPEASSQLTSWSAPECAAGGNACTFALDGPRTVTAVFSLRRYTVTVQVSGGGQVSSVVPGISNCSGTCSAIFPYGTLRLRGHNGAGNYLDHWSGCDTALGANCDLVLDADRLVTTAFLPSPGNFVFVTSTTYDGHKLGGVTGAATECQARADEGGISGGYVAWLSTTTTDAINQLASNSGPWFRRDGRPFAASRADLVAGRILYPPRLDEFGRDVPAANVLTATKPDGTRVSTNVQQMCQDWITPVGPYSESGVTLGFTAGGTGAWTQNSNSGFCNGPLPIYCLGTGSFPAVSPSPTPSPSARLAFFADGFDPSTGLSGADAICASAAAGLPGTYKAMLATTSAPALDPTRFDSTGAPWFRPDGVQLVARAADLFLAAPKLLAPINVTAARAYLGATSRAWFGANTPIAVGTDAQTCVDWTQRAISQFGLAVVVAAGQPNAMPSMQSVCDYFGVICLQQ
jgi:hypothetical protein